MPITDTSSAAQAVQLKFIARCQESSGFFWVYEMSMVARELNRARLLREYPQWPKASIARELLRLAFLPAPLPDGLR